MAEAEDIYGRKQIEQLSRLLDSQIVAAESSHSVEELKSRMAEAQRTIEKLGAMGANDQQMRRDERVKLGLKMAIKFPKQLVMLETSLSDKEGIALLKAHGYTDAEIREMVPDAMGRVGNA